MQITPIGAARASDRQPGFGDQAVLRAVIHIDRASVSLLTRSRPALRQAASDRENLAAQLRTVSGLRGRLSPGEAECFGMDPAIVLGPDFADRAWPVGDGAVAGLAARATGRWVTVTGKRRELDTEGRRGRVLFTLDVAGERFAIRRAGDGGTDYDRLSEPNKGYGFGSSGIPSRSVEEHRESIRAFLAMIGPNTGYMGDD